MSRWKTSKTAVFNLSYHMIWCPKYRRPVLIEEIATRLSQLLIKKSADLELEIVEMNILPEHVHIFVKAKPIHSPQYLVGQLKGYSSRILRQEFPKLRSRLPTLWTRSYYIDSAGRLNEYTIKKYVQNQKNK